MTAPTIYDNRATFPLYRVQKLAAMGDDVAVVELGARYALAYYAEKVDRYRRAIAQQYVDGWRGITGQFQGGRGGNHAAGLRAAYRAGWKDRTDCLLGMPIAKA